MMPASNRGAGMNIGFPDVCLTPAAPAPIPVPYPNMAMNAQAASFSPTVKVTFMPALNMGSKIPMSTGDEGGTAHPMFKTVGAYTMGNPIVLVSKLPAVNLLGDPRHLDWLAKQFHWLGKYQDTRLHHSYRFGRA